MEARLLETLPLLGHCSAAAAPAPAAPAASAAAVAASGGGGGQRGVMYCHFDELITLGYPCG